MNAYDIEQGDVLEHKRSGKLYEACASPIWWFNVLTDERAHVTVRDEGGTIKSFGVNFINSDFNIIR